MEKSLSVLVVEDEPIILEIVQDALQDAGFAVRPAPSYAIALDIINEEEIAGLITDIRLGDGADGWVIARHARRTRPDLPVVYMTGDSACEWHFQGVPQSVIVQKPFALAQIVTAVATLMNQVETAAAGQPTIS